MRVAILTIHGVGEQKPGFANDFHQALVARLVHNTKLEVGCFELEWQHLIEPQEDKMKEDLSSLNWDLTRYFALSYVGDVIAYAKDTSFYKNVHSELNQKLIEVNNWLGDDGKLYIVGHSLGTIIAFNFIYNLQNVEAMGNKIFRATSTDHMDKLECLFTFGSPLYIYSLQKDHGGSPINVKRWINVYSGFDVIGYPVRTINEEFASASYIEDKKVLCGGLLSFWNPLSHGTYLESKKIQKFIAGVIDSK